MPKFNATSSSDSSLPWSLYGSLPCSKVTVLPSGRKVTSTVFSPGASTMVVPVPCVFSSDMENPRFQSFKVSEFQGCQPGFHIETLKLCNPETCFIQNLLSPPDGRPAVLPRDRSRPWPFP